MNKEIINMKKCPRFNYCSVNSCPIDINAHFRKNLPDEDCCPFTIKKKTKKLKGTKTLAPHIILEVIPSKNQKMLNRRNQKRWLSLK